MRLAASDLAQTLNATLEGLPDGLVSERQAQGGSLIYMPMVKFIFSPVRNVMGHFPIDRPDTRIIERPSFFLYGKEPRQLN
jgi:hypothetical protein